MLKENVFAFSFILLPHERPHSLKIILPIEITNKKIIVDTFNNVEYNRHYSPKTTNKVDKRNATRIIFNTKQAYFAFINCY